MCSNHSAGYQLDIFTLIFKICIFRLKSTNIKEKEAKEAVKAQQTENKPAKQNDLNEEENIDPNVRVFILIFFTVVDLLFFS